MNLMPLSPFLVHDNILQILIQTAGDVDAAIEYLLAEQSDDLLLEESVPSSSSADACNGNDQFALISTKYLSC